MTEYIQFMKSEDLINSLNEKDIVLLSNDHGKEYLIPLIRKYFGGKKLIYPNGFSFAFELMSYDYYHGLPHEEKIIYKILADELKSAIISCGSIGHP